jgi:hypothetical protein
VTLLQWSWTLRFGPYARATFASQPVLLVVPFAAGVLVSVVVGRDSSLFAHLVFALVTVLALVVVLLVSVASGLQRLRRATGTTVQRYTLTTDVLQLALGQDQLSVPLRELTVARTGREWLALRRRAMGNRRLLLFFDDPSLLPQARALVEQHGAVERSWSTCP